MHRAWDVLLWALLVALAIATAAAMVSMESSAFFAGLDAILIVGPVGLVGCGMAISLEAAERGRQPRLAQFVRWAVLAGAVCAGLAVALGSTRTSPLVQVVLLCAAGAAAGIQSLTLGRLSIIGRWGRFARRFAIVAGCFGVLIPVVLMASIGLVTWLLAMTTRGEAPLADEGALPFAEFLGVVAVATACMLAMPLSVVAVACSVLGGRVGRRVDGGATERASPSSSETVTAQPFAHGLLGIPTTCPRCGDRRTRPFGGPWVCRACGLGGSASAPEMDCICGTSLVGVAGDRCPRCASAIRTRWGGPVAVAPSPGSTPVPSTPPTNAESRGGRRWIEAVAIVLLLLVPVAPLALAPGAPPGDLVATVFGWLLPVSLYCGVLWSGMLVVIDALARRRLVLRASLAGACMLGALAAWAVPLFSGMSLQARAAAIAAATVASVVSVGAVVAGRVKARGPMEKRLRAGALLLSTASMVLLLIEIGATSRSASAKPSAPLPASLEAVTASGIERLANWTACLALGAGFALVVGRRIERRRRTDPRALGLPSNAAIELSCPRCTAELRVPLRRRLLRCENCDLLIHASAFEARCCCGQSLMRLRGDRCPECGRIVPADPPNVPPAGSMVSAPATDP